MRRWCSYSHTPCLEARCGASAGMRLEHGTHYRTSRMVRRATYISAPCKPTQGTPHPGYGFPIGFGVLILAPQNSRVRNQRSWCGGHEEKLT
ncbi:hypothetical protein FA13DRAFT_714025 [Coprinellus micaceus]|uniref:Uncharacterized protein n=1 Tax=Coprinellus micaceus TaxID=71717 RepID=A0A4Y7TVJ5_COPMI|nr:hypothetical protein FA13DRAFT_714025 [Coprinellus micaceus]